MSTADDDAAAAAAELLERVREGSPGVAELEQDRAGSVGTPTDPAERWPPLAHDHMVAARTSPGWLGGIPFADDLAGDFERLHLRTYGLAPEVEADQDGAGGFANAPDPTQALERQLRIWQYDRPGESVEAVRWLDSEAKTIGPLVFDGTAPKVWEVARLSFPARGLSVLEQVAWAFEATATGSTTPFVGTACGALCNPFAVPTAAGAGSLSVRWFLLRASPECDPAAMLANQDPHALPRLPADFGLPRELGRAFAWGSRYTKDLHCTIPGDGGATLRLFAELAITGRGSGEGQWFVSLTGRLAGWAQQGGPLGRALANSSTRN